MIAISPAIESLYWTPEEMLKVAFIDEVKVSPDGKKVAFAVKKAPASDEIHEEITHIHCADISGNNSFPLTSGRESCLHHQWSPDGKLVGFISGRSGKEDVWVIRVEGGEAWQVTDAPAGVIDFIWSPDGRMIAYTSPDAPSSGGGQENCDYARVKVLEEDVQMSHIYLAELSDAHHERRKPRRLTGGGFSVVGLLGSPFGDWSPDGKTLVFTRTSAPDFNSWPSASLGLVEVDTGKITALGESGAALFSPLFSPDGKSLACLCSDIPPGWYFDFSIAVISLSDGALRPLAKTRDQMARLAGWSEDGSGLYFWENRGTGTAFSMLPADGAPPVDLLVDDRAISGFWLNRGRTMVGLTAQRWDFPMEAWVSGLDRINLQQVSRINAHVFRLKLGKTEVIRWKVSDGLEIEGLLTWPVRYEKGSCYPLVVQAHGGPAGVFSNNFLAALESQYPLASFSEMGFFVLRPNIRGSCGYGVGFRKANLNDLGGMDYEDLMAGVEHVISMGLADGDRLGIMGSSYGGYMTALSITRTRRFRAASCKAAITNFVSESGTTDLYDCNPGYFGGRFWEEPRLYIERSPIFNIKGVTTPTLIQHGEDDTRVPVSQSYELYRALKCQGVPVKMVLYPQTGHSGGFTPERFINFRKENIEWFSTYLAGGMKEGTTDHPAQVHAKSEAPSR